MNASMNDSHNLAWKMAHVLRGWADLSLLKTYEFERRKYAQDLIGFDKKIAQLFSGKACTGERKDGVTHEEFLSLFQDFGDFNTGIGIHYADSVIVHTVQQSQASNLIIGKRVVPQIFLRLADGRPFEIQDLLPADARFKILIFTCDSTNSEQQVKLNELATQLEGVLKIFSPGGEIFKAFEVLSFSTAKKEIARYTDLPKLFRSHWSKVFIDDSDTRGALGGGGYDYYGINKTEGAIVVVRPDGYVGTIASFDHVADLADYFAPFMLGAK